MANNFYQNLIIYPDNVEDVQAAIKWVVANKYDLAICGGGHSPAGTSSSEGGVVIDLRKLNAVTVDPVTKTARAQGGAHWAHLDKALFEHGLAVTGGTVSHTGIGGLTLGGGYGWLEVQSTYPYSSSGN